MGREHPLCCDLDALSTRQREHRAALVARLRAALRGVEPLTDGYRLQVDPASISEQELGELVDYERKCCAFLSFTIATGRKPWTVEVRGPGGVKEFLVAEFGFGG